MTLNQIYFAFGHYVDYTMEKEYSKPNAFRTNVLRGSAQPLLII